MTIAAQVHCFRRAYFSGSLRLVIGTLFIAACRDVQPPSAPTQSFATSTSRYGLAPTPAQDELPDDVDARIARDNLPGYAGVVQERDGSLTLLLSDTSDASAKRDWVAERYRRGGSPVSVARHRRVKFDFNQLKMAFNRIAHSNLDHARRTMDDIDEANNRILVRTATPRDAELARKAIRALDVPAEMVTVLSLPIDCQITDPECAPPPDPDECDPYTSDCSPPDGIAPPEGPEGSYFPQPCGGSTVNCATYNIVGGLSIKYKLGNTTPQNPSQNPWLYCTLGAVVSFKESLTAPTNTGILTASHCSATDVGYPDDTHFYQGPYDEGSFIWYQQPFASKWLDPSLRYVDPNCSQPCKDADVQLASRNGNRGYYMGRIALAHNDYGMSIASWDGGTTLDIKGQRGTGGPVDSNRLPLRGGVQVWKVGRSSGVTAGTVTNTCANVYSFTTGGSNVEYLCQYIVQNTSSHPVLEGDSGAAVFTARDGTSYVGGVPTAVSFEGILSARVISNNTWSFSPWFQINREFQRIAPDFLLSTVVLMQ